MMRAYRLIVPALLIAGAVSGCVHKTVIEPAPSASPVILDSKTACESAGGEWHSLTQHCDRD